MRRIVSWGAGVVLAIALFGGLVAGCDGGATSTCAVGSENCHCTAGASTCDPGLVCTVDKKCVRLAGGGGAAGGATGGGGSSGGTTGGGGAAGGATGGAPGGGGAGGAVASGAVGKFCHELARGGTQDIVLTLAIGTGGSAVRLNAWTLECSTAVGTACQSIPVGINVPVAMLDGNTLIASAVAPAIEAGKEYLFLGFFDDNRQAAVFDGFVLPSDTTCKDLDPFAPLPAAFLPVPDHRLRVTVPALAEIDATRALRLVRASRRAEADGPRQSILE